MHNAIRLYFDIERFLQENATSCYSSERTVLRTAENTGPSR